MTKSVWSENWRVFERNALYKDIDADVAVIGAGMAGLLTAYLLQKKGHHVVVIEANKTACGVTQNTTAKITSQHRLIYDRLIKEFGFEKAKQYAEINEAAILKYEELINEMNIDCDFEKKDAYVYAKEDDDNIKKEIEAANRLGICASYAKPTTLPFSVKGAVKFSHQAQFHPLKFLKPISEELIIYENTKALNIEDHTIITDRGNVKANYIVVATHYPFMNVPGFYFLRMHQQRSYVLGLENAVQVDGMYIDEDEKGFSFRNYNDLLLLGGAGHRSGKPLDESSYELLRRTASKWYPNAEEKYHWSAQDCVSVDEVPYIGQYAATTPNVYVATGFNKWGMTSSMAAALILLDAITEHKNKSADVFEPQRFNIPASAENFVTDVGVIVSGLASTVFKISDDKLIDIKNNSGGIIEHEGEKVGVYKDENGVAYFVSTKCTHLGCQLEWNQDELSWDCPCHGSRFDYKGKIINNPALKNLNDD